jgi:hypothetical protein
MHKVVATNALLPEQVRWASVLSFMMAAGFAVFSLPACLAGSFVGPHILVPGIVAILTALLLCAAANGVLSRRSWARWLLFLLSMCGAFAFSTVALIGLLHADIHPIAAFCFLALSVTFCFNVWALCGTSARAWFTDRSQI